MTFSFRGGLGAGSRRQKTAIGTVSVLGKLSLLKWELPQAITYIATAQFELARIAQQSALGSLPLHPGSWRCAPG